MNIANDTPHILHICLPEDWEKAKTQGEYKPASYSTDGFIHCSSPRQILQVANTVYHGNTKLYLLWINPSKLQAPLKWEISGSQPFPHIYGVLNLEAVEAVYDFIPDSDMVFRIIPGLSDHT